MFKSIVLGIFVVFISGTVICAQDDYFPIVENCITEPTLPPDDWRYSGTILMSGYAGVHGMNLDWETPRVLVFESNSANGDEPLAGASLSPDGKWYALPMGDTWVEVTYSRYSWVQNIRVYKTDGSGDFQVFDFDYYVYTATASSYLPMHWIDNESFMAGSVRLYPLEPDKAELSPLKYDITTFTYTAISPDITRFVELYSDEQGLYSLQDIEPILLHEHNTGFVAWREDSSGYINITRSDDTVSIDYHSRDGDSIDRIVQFENGQVRASIEASNRVLWSPDMTQFAFKWTKPYGDETQSDRIYIIDFENEQVIDTCLNSIGQPVWSPNGRFIAYLEKSNSNQNIIVVDLEIWQAFVVGKHIGTSAEMLGWRE